MIKILCKIGLVFFLLTSPVYAYLDPGTGNIIIQAILAFIATAITTLSFYWTKVKLFILKLLKKNNNDKEKNSDLN